MSASVFDPPQTEEVSGDENTASTTLSRTGDDLINRTFFTVNIAGSASAQTQWGQGELSSSASGQINGDLSRVTSAQTSGPVLAISEQREDVTFQWDSGFDNTQPITVTYRRQVVTEQLVNQPLGSVNISGTFRVKVLDSIAPGSDTQATSVYGSASGFGESFDELTVSVLDGGVVELFAKMDSTSNAFMNQSNPSSSPGGRALYGFWVEVPEGVLVTAPSGYNYTQVLNVPEPSSALVLFFGSACIARRRRRTR